ncbi:MAG: hypothetical protein WBB22_15070 [Anaerolineae bacterium]
MIAVALVLVVALGLSITLYLARQSDFLERLALAYCLGWGFLTLLMFCVSALGIPLSLSSIATPVVTITVILSGIWWRREGKRLDDLKFHPGDALRRIRQGLRGPSILERALLALVGVFLLYSLVMACYWPVHWWDAVTLYDLRARVFFDTHSIQETALRVQDPNYVMGLPPLTSLVHTWVYLAGGTNPKFFYSLLFASFLVISYYFMRVYSSRLGSLTFTALLSSTFIFVDHSAHAPTNLPFACYYALATAYLYRWILHQRKADLILAGLSLGLSGWARAESQVFFLGYLTILTFYSLRRKTYFAPLIFALLYLSIEPLWALYVTQVLHLPPTRGWTYVAGFVQMLAWSLFRSPRQLLGWTGLGTSAAAVFGGSFANWVASQPCSQEGSQLLTALGIVGRQLLESHSVSLCLFLVTAGLNVRNVKEHGYLFALAVSNLVLFVGAALVFVQIAPDSPVPLFAAGRLFMLVSPTLLYYAASTKPVRDLFDAHRIAPSRRPS